MRNLPKESHREIQIVETDFSMWKFKKWNRFSGCYSWAKFLMASRQMPVLGKDGKLYTQSNAILKLLGKEYDICINLTLDIPFIKQILINQKE